MDEENHPYYKIHWRLSLITICEKHDCILLDRCPNCRSPVLFTKNKVKLPSSNNETMITECHYCSFDLSQSDITLNRDIELRNFQTSIYNSFSSNLIKLYEMNEMYTQLFFPVFYKLLDVFIKKYYSPKTIYNHKRNRYFELYNTNLRYSLIQKVYPLFINWPKNFINFCKKNQLTSSLLLFDSKNTPYWYWETVNTLLNDYRYIPNTDEMYYMVNYLKRKKNIKKTFEFLIF